MCKIGSNEFLNTLKGGFLHFLCINKLLAISSQRASGNPQLIVVRSLSHLYIIFTQIMKKLLTLTFFLLFGCFNPCKGEDTNTVVNFLRSAYQLPYDIRTEMTDVTLVDAYYTNELQIDRLVSNTIDMFMSSSDVSQLNVALRTIYTASSMSNNANIQFFRERVSGDNYRLDTAPHLMTFQAYAWDNGQFTNAHPFLMNKISIPPNNSDSNLWTLYAVQPYANEVSVQSGKSPLLFNEGFYISLYGLPLLLRLNIIIETADPKSGAGHNFSNPNDPTGIQWFKVDEKRLADVLNGRGQFGTWTKIRSDIPNTSELSFVSADGTDHNVMRVLFNDSNPKQIYLAYVRDLNSGKYISLSAWNYDSDGKPVRFLKVERDPNIGSIKAWAQNIIDIEKTTNIDSSLFTVDLAKLKSVYDQRPMYPIMIVNHKVVFDASKDKYASLPGNRRLSWFDKAVEIRALIFTVLLVPPLVMLFVAWKQRNPK